MEVSSRGPPPLAQLHPRRAGTKPRPGQGRGAGGIALRPSCLGVSAQNAAAPAVVPAG